MAGVEIPAITTLVVALSGSGNELRAPLLVALLALRWVAEISKSYTCIL